MHKDFDHWNDEKKNIEHTAFIDFVHMREVWWCTLGVNLGREQDGNDEFFERPVLVVRKFNQDMVLVVPLTSQPKHTPYHFVFPYNGMQVAAVISQLRLVSTKRLKRRMFRMPEPLFEQIRVAIQRMIVSGT